MGAAGLAIASALPGFVIFFMIALTIGLRRRLAASAKRIAVMISAAASAAMTAGRLSFTASAADRRDEPGKGFLRPVRPSSDTSS